MRVRVLAVPYDLGHEDRGMGRGPGRWLEAGLPNALRAAGHAVEVTTVRRGSPWREELAAIEDVNGSLADAVRAAAERDELPLVLAGNCNSALGTVAGLGGAPIGVVWFDAHGDFNTPETSPGGFFDGMAISILTGACHRDMWERLASADPLPESHVVLAAVRDLDPAERVRLDGSEVLRVPADEIRARGIGDSLGPALDGLSDRVSSVYLHIDIDAVDPTVARVNSYQAPDGLTLEELRDAIDRIRARVEIRAAALTAFDPEHDGDGRGASAGIELARTLVG